MSDDCSWMADRIPHELQSNWYSLFGVADAVDHAARHALHVDIGIRTHFTRHDHQPGGAQRFAGDLRIGIAAQEFVEDGVGNLV